jgi:hypothetical protein
MDTGDTFASVISQTTSLGASAAIKSSSSLLFQKYKKINGGYKKKYIAIS